MNRRRSARRMERFARGFLYASCATGGAAILLTWAVAFSGQI